MAKSFDNISEAKAMNYQFLKAQMVISTAKQPPAPPPFYVLTMPWEFVVQPLLYLLGLKQKSPAFTGLMCLQTSHFWHRVEEAELREADYHQIWNDQLAKAMVRKLAENPEYYEQYGVEFKHAELAAFKVLSQLTNASNGRGSYIIIEGHEAKTHQTRRQCFVYSPPNAGVDPIKVAMDKELADAKFITKYIEMNEDDSAQQERWRIFVRRDTSTALSEVRKVHKQLEQVHEKLDELRPADEPSKAPIIPIKKVEKQLDSALLIKMDRKLDDVDAMRQRLANLEALHAQQQSKLEAMHELLKAPPAPTTDAFDGLAAKKLSQATLERLEALTSKIESLESSLKPYRVLDL